MATHFPAAYESNEAVRYLYRANHVYLLLGSLVNVALGIYRTPAQPGWRGAVALAGSALLLAAPFALFYAFFFEAPLAKPERGFTFLGVLLLLVGVLAQWPNRVTGTGGTRGEHSASPPRLRSPARFSPPTRRPIRRTLSS